MSEIVKANTSLNGVLNYRYEEVDTSILDYGMIKGIGPLSALCGATTLLSSILTVGSMFANPEMTLVAAGFMTATGFGTKLMATLDSKDAVHAYIHNISKDDAQKILKACHKKNRSEYLGTSLEIASADGLNAYKIKFKEKTMEVTSYKPASEKKAWDNQMAMFKSAYGIDKQTDALAKELVK